MMDFEYIAQSLASEFVLAKNKVEAANFIAQRISSLRHEDYSSLSLYECRLILQLISEFLSNKRVWKYGYGGTVVHPKAHDNESYLELIDYIFSQLGG